MRVCDAMRREVPTLRVDASLREACGLFARSGAEVLPVVERDEEGRMRRYAGAVTRADLVQRLLVGAGADPARGRRRRVRRGGLRRWRAARWGEPGAVAVGDFRRRVGGLRPDEPLAEAVARLLRSRLPALPVVDGEGGVLGLLSLGDLLGPASGAVRVPR